MHHHVSDRGIHCVSQLKSLDSQPLSPPPSLAAQPPEPGVEAGHVLRRVLLDGRASVLVLICLPYMSALYVCLIRAVGWACLGPRPPPILASSLPPSPPFPPPSPSVSLTASCPLSLCTCMLLHVHVLCCTHAPTRASARLHACARALILQGHQHGTHAHGHRWCKRWSRRGGRRVSVCVSW